MAMSKCPSCGNHRFELVEKEISNAAYKHMLIQCSSCGSVVGNTSYYDPGVTAKKVEDKIKELESQISNMHSNLVHNMQVLEKLIRSK
ncbi:MAG TPA: hypothetical protein VEF53_10225 [Patescibacteria group bacterium]|nr:hypothetical protein [Patescibacteria group bacterium]